MPATSKVTQKQRTVRSCTAPYQHMENGELKTSQIRVEYYSLTIRELKGYLAKTEERAKDKDVIVWLSETLADRLHGLHDLPDMPKPFPITVDNLDMIDIPNLEAIKDAIDQDTKGKLLPTKSVNG